MYYTIPFERGWRNMIWEHQASGPTCRGIRRSLPGLLLRIRGASPMGLNVMAHLIFLTSLLVWMLSLRLEGKGNCSGTRQEISGHGH